MFGYVIADKSALTETQLRRYRGSYCGLCRSIGTRCGLLCRSCLSYDLSFLALLLGGLFGCPETEEERVCPAHPFRKQFSFRSEAADYAADMNVLLGRYHCLDDWQDEKRPLRLLEYRLLRPGSERAAERWPRKAEQIRERLSELSDVERRQERSPDPGANAFGALMGELFVWKADRFPAELYELGAELGRYVYLADALADYEGDRKRKRYNPLTGLFEDGAKQEEILSILAFQAQTCDNRLETLPVERDKDILHHILQCGIWSIYEKGKKNT